MRVALLQSSGRLRDVAGNLQELEDTARDAAVAGVDLLICPELFLTGYAIGDDLHDLAEPAEGPAAARIGGFAVRHGIAVLYGYPERGEGGRLYNCAQLIGPDGSLLATYRKTHLFGEYERKHFTPGVTAVVRAEVCGLQVGMLICYDVEFPEPVRGHAVAGTDLLAVPTAQMRPFEFVADHVVPVRAFESQLYVAYVNRHGVEGEFDFVGRSCLAGPDGVTRARAGAGRELLLADVDPALLAGSRLANPYLRDRRPQLYQA